MKAGNLRCDGLISRALALIVGRIASSSLEQQLVPETLSQLVDL